MTRRLLLVAVGGAVGTLARHAVAELFGDSSTWPWPTFTVNLVGSFLLGVLAAKVVDPADPRRLLLGTGVLAGFTTYSAFAVETDLLLRDADLLIGVLYPTVTVALGLAAAVAGLVAGRRTA